MRNFSKDFRCQSIQQSRPEWLTTRTLYFQSANNQPSYVYLKFSSFTSQKLCIDVLSPFMVSIGIQIAQWKKRPFFFFAIANLCLLTWIIWIIRPGSTTQSSFWALWIPSHGQASVPSHKTGESWIRTILLLSHFSNWKNY